MKKTKLDDVFKSYIDKFRLLTGNIYSVELNPGEEVNTGITDIGLFLINIFGSGNSCIMFFTAFTADSALIAGRSDSFGVTDLQNRVCVIKKNNSGPLFIKNNTTGKRTIRLKALTTLIAN